MIEGQQLAAGENSHLNGETLGDKSASRECAPATFYPEQSNGAKHSLPPTVPTTQLVVAKAGHKKRASSNSSLSDTPEEDAGSDFEGQDSAASDDSFARSAKRRRKAEEAMQQRFRMPEDNEMRQKLRGHPQASLSATDDDSRAPSPNEGAASETESLTEAETDPTLIPERIVSAEEEREQKGRLKTSWELIAILDFLYIFQPYLNLQHLNFSAEELESCLVLNNGSSGLLPELHIGIMRGISTRSNLQMGNWAASLAEKLKIYWRNGRLPGIPPFKPQRRWEAVDYARLPLENRVTALRILCELRLEKDDLHNVVEYAIHPPRKTKAEKKAEALAAAQPRRRNAPVVPPPPTMDLVRKQPLARDSSGLMYWYLDYHTTTGTRMYRETPGSLLKGKLKKEQAEPQWELLSTMPEDLTDLGEKLRRSKKKADQNLASQILDDIVPELLDRREADFRKQKAAAKLQAQMNNILPSGRSRRARKEVNYSFDAYDATIRAALRQGSSEPEGRPTRSSRFHDAKMTAEEEAELGLRRGRSARAASPPLELPPTRKVKRASASSKDVTPEVDPSRDPSPETQPSREASPDGHAMAARYPYHEHFAPAGNIPAEFRPHYPGVSAQQPFFQPQGEAQALNGANGWGSREKHGSPPGPGESMSPDVEISNSSGRDYTRDQGPPYLDEEDPDSGHEEDLGMVDDPDDEDWR